MATETSDTGTGGFLSTLMQGLGNMTEGKGDQLTMIADLLGQRIAPNNIFGGIGTGITKSKMAGEKIASDQQNSAALLQKIIENLNSGSDMNQATFKRDPKTGEVTVNETSVMPQEKEKVAPMQKERSASTSDFMNLQKTPAPTSATPGGMKDLYNTYLGDSNGQ